MATFTIGEAAAGRGVYEGPGISIKLSALHPRYSRAKAERVMQELLPNVKKLAKLAKHYDIGLNIDAEEADRLEREKIDFFQAVRNEFLKLAAAEPKRFLVVDASVSPDEMFAHIAKKLDELLG